MREQQNRLDSILKTIVIRSFWLIAICSIMIFNQPSSEATVAQKATVKSLVNQAQLILHVRVEDQWSPKSRGKQGEIYTYSRLKPLDVWAGTLNVPNVVLVQLGGSIGDLHLKVHGDAQLKVGDEAVLFLSSSPQSTLPVPADKALTAYQTVHLISLAQGAFFVDPSHLQEDPHLKQNLDGLVFYSPQNDHLKLMHKAVDHEPTPLWTLRSLHERVNVLLGVQR